MNSGPHASIRYLDGKRLKRSLWAGFERIVAEQEPLNQINVFPVPDGDTGTNLALTVATITDALRQFDSRHAGELLTRVADAALDGARGNSGAIFAQFFQGLADALGDRERIHATEFAAALKAADEYARTALSSPKEGTIITVIGAYAEAIRGCADRDGAADFTTLLHAGLEVAQKSLQATTDQLEELRRAGVVDAGARGFVVMLEGIEAFLRQGSLTAATEPSKLSVTNPSTPNAAQWSGTVDHRYCTECVLNGQNIDLRKLRESLTDLGSSLVVAGNQNKIKIHIHVDEPSTVFDVASNFGAVSDQKADDILHQTETMRLANRRIAIVTDSAADMPDSAIHDLDIHIVSLRISFGSETYLDKVGLTPEQFLQELVSNPERARTSQPAPGDFRRMYDYLGSHFQHVISISLTKKASGTWQAAATAAQRAQRSDHITVVDSRNVSLGQGLIAMHAAECVRAGYSLDGVLTSVDEIAAQTRTFGLVTDLSYAVRGGRIRPSIKWLADRLRLTPILSNTIDGTIGVRNFMAGRRDLLRRFARHVARRTQPGKTYRVAIGHANCQDDANRLREELLDKLPGIESSYVTELGSAVGVHAGPGALLVSIQEYRPLSSNGRSKH
ncbi:MAG: DegV family protein [Gammaproteobacteria bacterium]